MNAGRPILMKYQRLQVGMALDFDSVEIVQFALIPGGRGRDARWPKESRLPPAR